MKYLKESLSEVKRLLDQNCYTHNYSDYEVFVNCIEAEDVDDIVDFIDKRLNDVTY